MGADGSLEPVPCGASNRCEWCAWRAATLSAMVLKIDADLYCPTVGMTTTTRSPDFSLEELRKAEQRLFQQLRRERRRAGQEEPLEYCAFLEWTTGEGTRSGGYRRPHLHHLIKGMQHEDLPALEEHVAELWHRYTGDAFVVECRPLRTPVGCIRYLALHHRKKAQAPPPGFSGRRLRPSKGYYDPELGIAGLRELAREAIRDSRIEAIVLKAFAIELEGAESPETWEADQQLTTALTDVLREMAADPREAQLDLERNVDYGEDRREFVRRAVARLRRLREEQPAELVRVLERTTIDKETGEIERRAVAVLGPVEPRRRRQLLRDAA